MSENIVSVINEFWLEVLVKTVSKKKVNQDHLGNDEQFLSEKEIFTDDEIIRNADLLSTINKQHLIFEKVNKSEADTVVNECLKNDSVESRQTENNRKIEFGHENYSDDLYINKHQILRKYIQKRYLAMIRKTADETIING
jgi:hypothetical protein